MINAASANVDSTASNFLQLPPLFCFPPLSQLLPAAVSAECCDLDLNLDWEIFHGCKGLSSISIIILPQILPTLWDIYRILRLDSRYITETLHPRPVQTSSNRDLTSTSTWEILGRRQKPILSITIIFPYI